MDLERAGRELRQALKRLAASDTRLKRRNARRALWGLMKQIKNAVNDQYPAMAKPKPPPEPKPEKPAKPAKLPAVKMPFRRGWKLATGDLFCRLVLSHYETGDHYADGGWYYGGGWDVFARKLAKITLGYAPDNPLSVATAGEGRDLHRRTLEIAELYRLFWAGKIFVADLVLAAEHVKFIEGRKK